MKNNKWILFLIILLSILAIALICFVILVINQKISFPNIGIMRSVSNNLVIDKIYDDTFNNINITTSASNIYVKKSVDSNSRIIVYANKEQASVDIINNDLVVNIIEENKILNFNFQISKIEIYLPETFDKKINIKNDYGDIEIDKFLNSEINVEEDCGTVTIIGGNVVNIENDYGDVKLQQANIANIEQSAGDIIIGNVNNINAKNEYGDIKIDKVTGYLKIEESCGDVEIDSIILDENSNIINNYGDIKINSTNEIYFDAKTNLGDVKINNNYPKSEISLKLENDCGDIRINN